MLVLNVIRGLAERFEGVGRHLRLSRELPTFLEVRSALILEELTMDQRPSSTSTALLASGDRQPAGGRSSSSSRPRLSSSSSTAPPPGTPVAAAPPRRPLLTAALLRRQGEPAVRLPKLRQRLPGG
jgi:hypothetical protein